MSLVDIAVDARPEHGEGPCWDERTGALWWVDILGGVVHRSDPATGADEAIEVGQPVGALVCRTGDGVMLAVEHGFAALDGGTVRPLATVVDDPGVRFNDGKADPAGRFLAGTMAYDVTPGAGALFRFEPDGRVEPVLDGLTISNGLAWTPEASTMYFIDSPTQQVRAYHYDLDSGVATEPRTIVDIPASDGLPDGMTIDADGCLWVALHGGGTVRRYTPDGHCDRVVTLPVSQVTSCAFGGSDLRRLFITTSPYGLDGAQRAAQPHAGAVFSYDASVGGLPAHRYAG